MSQKAARVVDGEGRKSKKPSISPFAVALPGFDDLPVKQKRALAGSEAAHAGSPLKTTATNKPRAFSAGLLRKSHEPFPEDNPGHSSPLQDDPRRASNPTLEMGPSNSAGPNNSAGALASAPRPSPRRQVPAWAAPPNSVELAAAANAADAVTGSSRGVDAADLASTDDDAGWVSPRRAGARLEPLRELPRVAAGQGVPLGREDGSDDGEDGEEEDLLSDEAAGDDAGDHAHSHDQDGRHQGAGGHEGAHGGDGHGRHAHSPYEPGRARGKRSPTAAGAGGQASPFWRRIQIPVTDAGDISVVGGESSLAMARGAASVAETSSIVDATSPGATSPSSALLREESSGTPIGHGWSAATIKKLRGQVQARVREEAEKEVREARAELRRATGDLARRVAELEGQLAAEQEGRRVKEQEFKARATSMAVMREQYADAKSRLEQVQAALDGEQRRAEKARDRRDKWWEKEAGERAKEAHDKGVVEGRADGERMVERMARRCERKMSRVLKDVHAGTIAMEKDLGQLMLDAHGGVRQHRDVLATVMADSMQMHREMIAAIKLINADMYALRLEGMAAKGGIAEGLSGHFHRMWDRALADAATHAQQLTATLEARDSTIRVAEAENVVLRANLREAYDEIERMRAMVADERRTQDHCVAEVRELQVQLQAAQAEEQAALLMMEDAVKAQRELETRHREALAELKVLRAERESWARSQEDAASLRAKAQRMLARAAKTLQAAERSLKESAHKADVMACGAQNRMLAHAQELERRLEEMRWDNAATMQMILSEFERVFGYGQSVGLQYTRYFRRMLRVFRLHYFCRPTPSGRTESLATGGKGTPDGGTLGCRATFDKLPHFTSAAVLAAAADAIAARQAEVEAESGKREGDGGPRGNPASNPEVSGGPRKILLAGRGGGGNSSAAGRDGGGGLKGNSSTDSDDDYAIADKLKGRTKKRVGELLGGPRQHNNGGTALGRCGLSLEEIFVVLLRYRDQRLLLGLSDISYMLPPSLVASGRRRSTSSPAGGKPLGTWETSKNSTLNSLNGTAWTGGSLTTRGEGKAHWGGPIAGPLEEELYGKVYDATGSGDGECPLLAPYDVGELREEPMSYLDEVRDLRAEATTNMELKAEAEAAGLPWLQRRMGLRHAPGYARDRLAHRRMLREFCKLEGCVLLMLAENVAMSSAGGGHGPDRGLGDPGVKASLTLGRRISGEGRGLPSRVVKAAIARDSFLPHDWYQKNKKREPPEGFSYDAPPARNNDAKLVLSSIRGAKELIQQIR